MSNLATDSSEVGVPGPAAKPSNVATQDRGATMSRGNMVKIGVGGLAIAGVLGFAAFGSLFSSGPVETDEQEQPAQANNMEDVPADTATYDDGLYTDDDPPAGDGEDAEGVEGEEDTVSDAQAAREARLAALQAERERRLAEARAAALERDRAAVMVVTGSSGPARSRPVAAGGVASGGGDFSLARDEQQSGGLSDRLRTSPVQRVRASRLPNRGFSIEAGTQIGCVLETAIDSTLSGLVTCLLPYDVRSATGQVVLLERGSRVLGEYQGGIQQGEARVFVVWNRVVSPNGVAIDLGSPASDGLGRAGVEGDVENFFFKKYGAALLLSIVGDASGAIAGRVSGADQTFSTPNQAASDALRNDSNIRPVLRAPQGSSLVITAARDLDFSDIYALRLRR